MGSPPRGAALYRDIVSFAFYSDAASAYIGIVPDRMTLFEAWVSPMPKLPTRLYAIRTNPEARSSASSSFIALILFESIISQIEVKMRLNRNNEICLPQKISDSREIRKTVIDFNFTILVWFLKKGNNLLNIIMCINNIHYIFSKYIKRRWTSHTNNLNILFVIFYQSHRDL